MMDPSYTPALLASGQLSNVKGALFTVPAKFRAEVDHITFFNTSGGALSCSLFINFGSSREIRRTSVDAGAHSIIIDRNAPIYLDAGQIIEGLAGAATSVNYHIFGSYKVKQ